MKGFICISQISNLLSGISFEELGLCDDLGEFDDVEDDEVGEAISILADEFVEVGT